MGRLFGTDGVRGVAITELTCELVMNIGRAAALVLSRHLQGGKKPVLLVGKDTRISSDTLEAALIAGITSVGSNVDLLGVVPTPALAFLIKEFKADAGVMISASHNPVADNGIKLFSNSGEKLPDEIETEIEELIFDTPEKLILKSGTEIGKIRILNSGKHIYKNHIKSCIDGDLKGMKLLIDCANGSASSCADVFTEMGVDCEFIGNEPTGLNINNNCGSTHLEKLCLKVRAGNYHAGAAFDGDADRCLFVDEKGNEINGDKIIALLAKSMNKAGILAKSTVVVTVMSNLGFHEFMRENNIATICTKVGDRYVYEEMKKSGCNLGGENSGHIILTDYSGTGDGILAAVKLLSLIKSSGKPLSELVYPIKDYPQKLINIKINAEMRNTWDKNESIKNIIKEAESFFGNEGRVLVRASGTEPLLRIMIEGKNETEVDGWVNKIKDVVNENCM